MENRLLQNKLIVKIKNLFKPSKIERPESVLLEKFINLTDKNEIYQMEIYYNDIVIMELQPLKFIKSWYKKSNINKEFNDGYILFLWINNNQIQKNNWYKNIKENNLDEKFFTDIVFDRNNEIRYFIKTFSKHQSTTEIVDSIYLIYKDVYDLKNKEVTYGVLRKIPFKFIDNA